MVTPGRTWGVMKSSVSAARLPGPAHAGETRGIVQFDDAAIVVLRLDASELIHDLNLGLAGPGCQWAVAAYLRRGGGV